MRIDSGRLHGVSPGDRIELLVRGEQQGTSGTVKTVFDDCATVHFDDSQNTLESGHVVIRKTHRPRRMVSLDAEAHRVHGLHEMLARAPWLQLVDGDQRGDVHVEFREGTLVVPGHHQRPYKTDEHSIREFVRRLDDTARAKILWPILGTAPGFGDPPWLCWRARVMVRVGDDGPRQVEPNETLYPGDELFVEVDYDRAFGPPIYVNAVDRGLSHRLRLLNHSQPAGVQLPPGGHEVIGQIPGRRPGLRVVWPSDIDPKKSDGVERIAVVASLRPLDLRALLQEGSSGSRGARDLDDRTDPGEANRDSLRWDTKLVAFRLDPQPRPRK